MVGSTCHSEGRVCPRNPLFPDTALSSLRFWRGFTARLRDDVLHQFAFRARPIFKGIARGALAFEINVIGAESDLFARRNIAGFCGGRFLRFGRGRFIGCEHGALLSVSSVHFSTRGIHAACRTGRFVIAWCCFVQRAVARLRAPPRHKMKLLQLRPVLLQAELDGYRQVHRHRLAVEARRLIFPLVQRVHGRLV